MATDAVGQDTEMSEDIEDGPETDVTATADKNPEIGKWSKTHSQDQNKTEEEELGEPTEEDSMFDALRAGSRVYIDLSDTPERSSPECSIPDSYAGAEEETIDQSRDWPA